MNVNAHLNVSACFHQHVCTYLCLFILHVPPPLHLCILMWFMMRVCACVCSFMCVCVQGQPDWRLLIKKAIAAKVCLPINIGLSDSGEEPVLLQSDVHCRNKHEHAVWAACLPKIFHIGPILFNLHFIWTLFGYDTTWYLSSFLFSSFISQFVCHCLPSAVFGGITLCKASFSSSAPGALSKGSVHRYNR